MSDTDLTERQKNEIEYHKEHARRVSVEAAEVPYEIITSSDRRLHNAYWHFYTQLLKEPLQNKRVLVVGCGAGPDALRIAKMGASVYAFDISPDMLELARASAERAGFDIEFSVMPAEKLDAYEDNFFDYVIAIDILHHVDVPEAMDEIVRVSKNGSKFFLDEIYSHSWTDRVRKSRFVEGFLYPLMVKWVYKNEKPYITEDERKLTEEDINIISNHLSSVTYRKYFNFIVTRLIPDRFDTVNKLDYRLLCLMGGAGKYVAGRMLMAGVVSKPAN